MIGRLRGVTDIPWMGPFGQQGGFTAWLLWLLIHITYLIGFANRIVVVTRWAFSFLTRGRSTRLITGSRSCRRSRRRCRSSRTSRASSARGRANAANGGRSRGRRVAAAATDGHR